MPIRPEVRVFITSLREGKSSNDAFKEYCWAKSVLPIHAEDLRHHASGGDPYKCPVHWDTMAEAKAADTFDAGASDEEVAEAFAKGLEYDSERGVLWRAMRKHERPTAGELIRAMTTDERMAAASLLGVAYVARAIPSGVR